MPTIRTTTTEYDVSVANNTSSLKINVYFSPDNWQTYFDHAWLTVNCNGQSQGRDVTLERGGNVSADFYFANIQHNTDGKKTVGWDWNCPTGTSVLGTASDAGSTKLTDIPRYAKTNSVSGDNIENSFSVNYTKYVNTYTYKLRITIPNVKTLETIDYNTSDAAFTLSKASIEEIYDYFPDTNSFELGFAVETYNNGTKVSDGNEVKKQCSKTDRIIRVKISDEWKRATPYVRVNGEWKKAIPYTRINNEWKRGR